MGMAGGAVVAAAMIGVSGAPIARADATTPADLLGDAYTELTDANQVLSQVPSDDIASYLAGQTADQYTALQGLAA